VPNGVVKFAEFELDRGRYELRRGDNVLKLEKIPMELLVLLVENNGQLVTRDEIVERIWGRDVFLDTEHGINTAIRKIRQALGDDPEQPRFLQTVTGKGYRFIAATAAISSVHGNGSQGAPRPELADTPPADFRPERLDGANADREIPAAAIATKPTVVVAAVITLVAVAIAGGLIWRTRPAKHLTDKDTIVLGEFANSTGDAVFDGTLREGLAVELQQSPFLSLLSDQEVHESLQMMGKPANAQLIPEVTREVCIRTGSVVAVEGSIALIGTRYNLILKAIDCASGDLFASSEAQASDKSHVLDALGNAASAIRKKLGESLGSLQRYNTPLRQMTTPSLEALQAFNLGSSARGSGDDLAAVQFFERATQLDPNFAMAYDAMGDAHGDIGETVLSAEEIAKAYGLRAEVGEREKLLIEAEFHNLNTGDLVKVRRICEVGVRTYPRETGFRIDLGSVSYSLGQYEGGIGENREILRVRPNSSYVYRQLLLGHLALNQIEDAEAIAREAHAKGVDANLEALLYGIAFYRDDDAEMARQAARAMGMPGEDLLLAMEADTSAFHGHLGKARQLSRRAADSAERASEKETAAGYFAVAALREALFGNAASARQEIAATKLRSSGRDVEYGLALALAYAGEEGQARALSEDLDMRFPEDTIVHFNYVPVLRAKLALLHSNPQEALDNLAVATPYEFGLPSFSFYNWPNLYPAYVRGEAYLAANRGKEAAAEFQKILTHRGLVLNEPIGALAHLGMARAYALDGDTANSRAAYQDFLALWRDGDPNLPVLWQAKAEYAKLQ